MKRILSTTALVVALAGPAMADGHSAGFGTVTFEQSDFFASDLIGMRIYNSEVEIETDAMVDDAASLDWEDIGEINDIIVSKDGDIRAVILGVGGFLGLGERDVSVSMDAIKVVQERDGEGRFLVVETSKEMLEQAPVFEREDDAATTDASTDAMADEDSDGTRTTAIDAMERQPLARPAVEREGYQPAEPEMIAQLTADKLQGAYVYGANDETVGEIDRLVMADDGKVSEVVINVGGFLGLGEKPVGVTWDELQVLKSEEGDEYRIYIESTKEKLEAQPDYSDS